MCRRGLGGRARACLDHADVVGAVANRQRDLPGAVAHLAHRAGSCMHERARQTARPLGQRSPYIASAFFGVSLKQGRFW
jgi:hypothetical protein